MKIVLEKYARGLVKFCEDSPAATEPIGAHRKRKLAWKWKPCSSSVASTTVNELLASLYYIDLLLLLFTITPKSCKPITKYTLSAVTDCLAGFWWSTERHTLQFLYTSLLLINIKKRCYLSSHAVFKNRSKSLTFIVTVSVTFESFVDSFLPLENYFGFFQIILHCKYPQSERIWKNLQGAKTIHQRFFISFTLLAWLAKMRLFW